MADRAALLSAPSTPSSRPLRVLHVSQATNAGVRFYLKSLIDAGATRGDCVILASPNRDDLPCYAPSVGATWIELPMHRQPHVSDIRIVFRLRRLFDDADIVHLHASKGGALGRLALVSMRRPPKSVFTPNGWSWLVGGPLASVYRFMEFALASVTDSVIVVSDEERIAGVPVTKERIRRLEVIENGIDTDRYKPPPALPVNDVPLVVCVGRLARQKGQDIAVRALPFMRNANARLRLVGDGPLLADLVNLVGELNLADRVVFWGHDDDSARHLGDADVVVVPSRWDGLSFVLLEAMACGRPIVAATAIGSGAADGCALHVPPDDPSALASALDALIDDGALADSLGTSGRVRAIQRYSLERSVGSTLALYDSLLVGPVG